MNSFSSINEEHLNSLSPEQAVEVFRELLWAEARSIGLPLKAVSITKSIYIPDGGIDASVEAGVLKTEADLIRGGTTSFQIKAGEFKPWNSGAAKKELFGKGEASKENLNSGVAECLTNGGTYVTVLFGLSPTEQEKQKALENYHQLLESAGYQDVKIDVIGQSELLAYLAKFPSLKLKLNGRINSGLRIYDNWANENEMRQTFVPGAKQQEFITGIQEQVRIADQSVHVRVLGEAGIGKTRLVFESVGAEDLKPLVVYSENPEVLEQSEFLNEITLPDSPLTAILVVDECEQERAHSLWNKLKNCEGRIKLLTIFNEFGPVAREETRMEVPGLEEGEITKIIENYNVPNDQARRWARFCENSPRVAHVIGQNLNENPDDPLRLPGTVDVWGRFIAGRGESREEIERRKTVLRFISLFKRFGFGKPVINEARAIHALIQESHVEITWPVFVQTVEILKRRKILQGQNTLYLTPKALHIWLWKEWWKDHGPGLDIKEFSEKLPTGLREWFYEMFRYAAGSEEASALVKEMLSEEGPFNDVEFLKDKLGSSFFLALSEADPESALERLEKIIGPLGKEELLQFTQGRREVLWSLERIAVWKELFPRAAKLLLKLAEAENDTIYSNNATGIFKDLFTLGHHQLAPTEAPPSERFILIEEALRSESKEQQKIALQALDRALEIHFSRAVGAENQGLRRKAELWAPKTWGEVHDAYRHVWKLLEQSSNNLSGEERRFAIDKLLENASSLGRLPVFSKMVLQSLEQMHELAQVDQNEIVKRVIHVLHYGKNELEPATLKDWETFKGKLVGDDFHSRLNRYVGLDLLEDQFEDGEYGPEKLEQRIKSLAEEAIKDPSTLTKEFAWLATTQAKNGYLFGYNLGLVDEGYKLFEPILESYSEAKKDGASLFFLGGYLRAMHDNHLELYESEISKLAANPEFYKSIPELIWRGGLTDRLAELILTMAQEQKFDSNTFGLFVYGAAVRNLSEESFMRWVNFLLSTKKRQDITNALGLFHFFYDKNSGRELPKDLTLKLLTADVLFEEDKNGSFRNDVMEDFNWTQIAKMYFEKYPEEGWKIAEKVIRNAGNSGSIVGHIEREMKELLNEITRKYPERVLDTILESSDGMFFLKGWLTGEDIWDSFGKSNEIVGLLPFEKLWKWVDEDVESRAWYIASFVPKDLFNDPNRICLARELLIRYGHREDVRRNLMANFSTEGWSGPASAHYQRKKDWLLTFKKTETSEIVKQWVDEYVKILDKEIEQAKVQEERSDW